MKYLIALLTVTVICQQAFGMDVPFRAEAAAINTTPIPKIPILTDVKFEEPIQHMAAQAAYMPIKGSLLKDPTERLRKQAALMDQQALAIGTLRNDRELFETTSRLAYAELDFAEWRTFMEDQAHHISPVASLEQLITTQMEQFVKQINEYRKFIADKKAFYAVIPLSRAAQIDVILRAQYDLDYFYNLVKRAGPAGGIELQLVETYLKAKKDTQPATAAATHWAGY